MVDATPRHVGDMQYPVDAADVDESTVIRDVLDHSLQDHALVQNREGLLLEHLPFLLQQNLARHHHVVTHPVVFENREPIPLAHELVEIAGRPNVHVGSGEKTIDADVHLESALDPGDDDALDGGHLIVRLLDSVPDLDALGLLTGEHDLTPISFRRFEEDVHLIANAHLQRSIAILELLNRNAALGLVTHVNHHVGRVYVNHRAGDHPTRLHRLHTLFEHRLKALFERRLKVVLGGHRFLALRNFVALRRLLDFQSLLGFQSFLALRSFLALVSLNFRH